MRGAEGRHLSPEHVVGSPGLLAVLVRERGAATGILKNLFCGSIQEVIF